MEFGPQILELIPRIISKEGNTFAISKVEELFLSKVDGKNSVAQIGEHFGYDTAMVIEIYARLSGKKLISADSKVKEQAKNQESEELLSFFDKLGQVNHYELLGVTPDATRAEIRSAYFTLSKKYHPDRIFGDRNLATAQKMSKIFQGLTDAYDVLSGKSSRAAYDKDVESDIELWRMGNSLRQAVSQSNANSSSNHVSEEKKSSVRNSFSEDRVDIRGAARISRIPAVRTSMIPGPLKDSVQKAENVPAKAVVTAKTPTPVPEPIFISSSGGDSNKDADVWAKRQQWKAERLKRSLRNSGAFNDPMTSADEKITKRTYDYLLEHAKMALEQEEYDLAVNCLDEILSKDSSNSHVLQLLKVAQKGKNKSVAIEYMRKARIFLSEKNWKESLRCFEEVLRIDEGNVEARFYIAEIFFYFRRNLPRGFQLCKEIVGLGGKKARYFDLLGEYFLLQKENIQAAEAFERALKIEPNNKEISKKIKMLKH